MTEDLAARAAEGDQEAQIEIVNQLLILVRDGGWPDDDMLDHAEDWARVAASDGVIWHLLRLAEVLALRAGYTLSMGETRRAQDYAAEALCILNALADAGFDGAEPQLLSLGQRIAESGLGIEPFRLAALMPSPF